MEATKVMTNHTPAIRAILLCFGDCSGKEIDMPVLYFMSSGIPLAGTRALGPAGSAPPVGRPPGEDRFHDASLRHPLGTRDAPERHRRGAWALQSDRALLPASPRRRRLGHLHRPARDRRDPRRLRHAILTVRDPVIRLLRLDRSAARSGRPPPASVALPVSARGSSRGFSRATGAVGAAVARESADALELGPARGSEERGPNRGRPRRHVPGRAIASVDDTSRTRTSAAAAIAASPRVG